MKFLEMSVFLLLMEQNSFEVIIFLWIFKQKKITRLTPTLRYMYTIYNTQNITQVYLPIFI